MNDNREIEAQRKVNQLLEKTGFALDPLWNSITWAVFPDSDTVEAFQEDELLHLMWANANTQLLETLCNQLIEIAEANKGVDIFPNLNAQYSVSGYFLLLDQKDRALEFFPKQNIAVSSQRATEHLLSLKYATATRLSARDLMTLRGPKVTPFGKEHLPDVLDYIDTILRIQQQEAGIDLIADWVKDSKSYYYNIGLGDLIDPQNSRATKTTRLLANVYCTNNPKAVNAYSFGENERVVAFIKTITRQAENVVREEQGIPRVGEGWIAETQLYYEIKEALPDLEVQHHASPDWLGQQHLDIYIPKLKIAIEYQGAQHDQPVEYFGGVEAFEKTKKRDSRKRRLCKKHGVNLIYVRPGYIFRNVLREIEGIKTNS